jgi:hypothetical protein
MTETSLAIYDPTKYPVIADARRAASIVPQLQSAGLRVWDFERFKAPQGESALLWSMEGSDGTETAVKEIVGVVVAVQSRLRAWWRKSMSESTTKSPPDCSSDNGVTGFGVRSIPKPGEPDTEVASELACAACGWSRFGSSRNPEKPGSDCRLAARIYLFREGSFLPSMVQVPLMSIPNIRKHMRKLIQEGRDFREIVTSITLERAVNSRGIKYAQVSLASVCDLPPEHRARAQALAKDLESYLHGVAVDIDPSELDGAVE